VEENRFVNTSDRGLRVLSAVAEVFVNARDKKARVESAIL
jgi:hypothetical protein